ncbi:MAG: dihydrofolate synthase [Bacteroidetes bacterium HGW-Bacteroidetes-1]|jgi:dihydrofolate synthase/folylpolyglutamate synthase|nr:MAG: dihydrofolate synthase [Bacteroidetes bacterium HGW-Bacteroidetes-1]
MNYKETIEWMFNKLPMYQRIGSAAYRSDLNNTIQLLELLNQPHNLFRSIHVAGTNGKGSVSHMLASVLQEAGYKTGLYTSPHLKDFRERIRINGEMISPENVVRFIEKNYDAFETMDLSFFEMTVGMAFDYFAEQKVDIAIIETGMGGRLDSTNLIDPLVSIITNIGFDHTQFLGDTLSKIAFEKAGIIKKSKQVIIGETQLEVKDVFLQKAEKTGSPILFADYVFDANKIQNANPQVQCFDIWKNSNQYIEELEIPLLGTYQKKNIITAIAAIAHIQAYFEISEKNIRDGMEALIRNTGFSGRWQILSRNPLTIADTGHNVDGLREIVFQLRLMQFNHLHFVLGMVGDKAIDAMLQLLPRHATYYFCKADIPRAMPADQLAAKAFELGLRGNVYSSVRDAYFSAINAARSEDLIFVGGSTFVVAEVV